MEKPSKKKSRPYKWWIGGIFTFLILAVTLVVWWEEKSGGACHETNSSQTVANSAPPEFLSRNGIPKEQEAPQQTNQAAAKSESYLCRLIAPANLPNIYLVLVGIGGVLAAIFTLEIISQQARSMRYQTTHLKNSMIHAGEAAQAALLNAQAVINAERPWLLNPMGENFPEIKTPILIARLPGEFRDSYCNFMLKNFGRSPAKVIEQKFCLVIGDSAQLIPSLDPYDKKDAVQEDYTFPQGEQMWIPISFSGDIRMISEQERKDIFEQSKFLWLCGYCKYMDTFERKGAPMYETKFCFRWVSHAIAYADKETHTSFWVMAGAREYNRAT